MLCYLEATGLNVGCRGHELACHGVSNYIFGCNKAAGSKAGKGQPLATQGAEEDAGHEQVTFADRQGSSADIGSRSDKNVIKK
jgi:hypothetical protein